jgi:hypothetical protein
VLFFCFFFDHIITARAAPVREASAAPPVVAIRAHMNAAIASVMETTGLTEEGTPVVLVRDSNAPT